MTTRKLLGARIKELRKQRGLTQEKLADIIKVDPKHISRIEVGGSYPSIESLEKMANALHVEIKDFFEYNHLSKNHRDLKETLIRLLDETNKEKLQLINKIVRALVR